jgi:hypothetical protein
MRIVLVLICSFALASFALGAQEENKSKKSAPKKKQAQSAQHAAVPGGGPQKAKGSQQVATPGGHRTAVTQPPAVTQKSAGGRSAEGPGAQKTKKAKGSQQVATAKAQAAGAGAQKTKQKTKGSQQIAIQGGQTAGGSAGAQKAKKSKGSATNAAAVQAKGKPFKPQHFNLASKTRPNTSVAPAVNFRQNRRIEGSQNWQGSNYQVFRNYRSEWHDRDWWRHNHSRIVFVFGGPYYWNSGYWFPAWGYDPGAYYAYEGPIYAYNDLPPDQVIANVQAALQQQGYYHGEVDGLIGPLTREAIANYQRDHGLYMTSTIDRPTLESLGMA